MNRVVDTRAGKGAGVDLIVARAAESMLGSWRERVQRVRAGDLDAFDERPRAHGTDDRGMFGTLLEHSHDGIVVSDVGDGWMLECSRSFEQMTGYVRYELLGRTSVELALIEPAIRRRAVRSTRESRSTGLHQTPLRHKNGETRWVEFSAQLLSGDELLLTIVRDVTASRGLAPAARDN